MATVIDALVVTLGLDPKGFDQGQRQAIQQLRSFESQAGRSVQNVQGQFGASFRSISGFIYGLEAPLVLLRRHLEATVSKSEETTHRLKSAGEAGTKTGGLLHEGALAGSRGFTILAGSALVALAAITALNSAIKAFKDTSHDIFATTIRARTAGMPIEQLSALSTALHVHGAVPKEETEEAAARLEQRRQAALWGQDPGYFRDLSLAGVRDVMATGTDLWRQLAEGLRQIPDERTAIYRGGKLGLSPQQVHTLREAGSELGRWIEQAQKLAVTPQQAEAAERFQKALARMEDQFSALSRVLFEKVEPYLEPVINFFSSLAEIFQALLEGNFSKAGRIWREGIEAPGGSGLEHPPPGTKMTSATEEERHVLSLVRSREGPSYVGQNPKSSASGAYSIMDSTWQLAARGTGIGREFAHAKDAPPEIQDINALWLLRTYGPNASITWRETGPKQGRPYPDPYGGRYGSGAGQPAEQGGTGESPHDYMMRMLFGDPKEWKQDLEGFKHRLDDLRRWLSGADFDKDPPHKQQQRQQHQTSPAAPATSSTPSAPATSSTPSAPATAPAATTPPAHPVMPSPGQLLGSIRSGSVQVASAAPMSNDNSITIGDINVYAQTNDPQGIARAVNDGIQRNLRVANAATGLS